MRNTACQGTGGATADMCTARLRAETKELREQITKLDEEYFKDDDEKVKSFIQGSLTGTYL